MNPARRVKELLLHFGIIVTDGEVEVALLKLSINHDVLDVPDIRVQHDGGDRVDPPEHVGRCAVEDDNVGFCALDQHADVGPTKSEAAGARREQERLVRRHGVVAWNLPVGAHLVVEEESDRLQPDPGLRDDVRTVRKVRVDAQCGLILDQLAVGVPVAVMHLRLRGDGEVLVGGAEEFCILHCEVAAVGEDNRNGGIEDTIAIG